MTLRAHAQGMCPGPTEELRVVGDVTRHVHRLCADCRRVYEAAPFSFTFVSSAMPEWQLRGREGSNHAVDRTGLQL